MSDWKLIATGRGLVIPDDEMEKIAVVLEAMEAGLRALVPTIPLLVEPVVTFRCAPEEEEA